VKTISAGLAAHLAAETTSIATCLKITRTDAQVFGFTDHDRDLDVSGTTYRSTLGYTRSAIVTEAALNVDNLDVRGFLDPLGLSEADILAGKWDFATVNLFAVNWADLTQGTLKLRRGALGEVSVTRDFTVELRGLAQWLQQTIGEVASETCKADLFDARCKLVDTVGVWKFTGVAVSTIVAAQRQWTSGALAQAADFFTAGKVLWQTGANAGLAKEIKTHASGGNLLLQEPMPYVINVGDTFTIWAGCRKRFTEDCGATFANQVNFRGFPHLPGTDQMLKGPT
jgi:uncharacterized phage protein (TIGR02218 family)